MRLCFFLEPLEPRRCLSAGFLPADGVPGGAILLDLGNEVSSPRFFFQPDGKFIATDNLPDDGPDCPGEWSEYNGKRFFARFNPDGSRDLAYGENGAVNYPCLEDDFDLFLQQGNGKILAVNASGGVSRFTGGGRFDSSFNSTDELAIPYDVGYSVSEQIALAPDGGFFLAGQAWPNHNPIGFRQTHSSILFLLSFNADGTPNLSFGEGGSASRKYMNAFGWASDLAVQPDGKILVATGDHTDPFGQKPGTLLRFNPDGTPDEDFAADGQFRFDRQEFGGPILLQPDGKIILQVSQGDYGGPNLPDLTLLRLNPDGTLDKSFGAGGRSSYEWAASPLWERLLLQPDDKILAIDSEGMIARFTRNGALDPTFGSGGSIMLASPDPDYSFTIDDSSLRPDGHLLLLAQRDNCWGDCDEFSEYLVDITTGSAQPSGRTSEDGSILISALPPKFTNVPPAVLELDLPESDPTPTPTHHAPQPRLMPLPVSLESPAEPDTDAPAAPGLTSNLFEQDPQDPFQSDNFETDSWLD
jgi:uncharacterized delta-60 repeat protein